MTAYIATAAFLAGIIATYILMRFWHRLDQRISELEKLKAAQPKRHTLSTNRGLEDAIAVAIDLTFKQHADQERLRTLMEILHTMREGPRSYNPDRECGRRPEGFED